MGFFSQDCEGCGHPLLSHWASTPINRWMEEAVVVTHEGELIAGLYDGYGRIDPEDDDEGPVGDRSWETPNEGPTVWHKACWLISGSPTEWRGSSRSSWCQGYFFDREHNVPLPKTENDLGRAAQYAKNMIKGQEAAMRAARAAYDAKEGK